MNYRRIYNQLIMRAWRRGGVDGYKETHHIIPRCQGGGNSKDNLVDLTAAEHYIAHLLLMKMHPDFHKLALPILLMGINLGRGVKNKLYEKARRTVSEGLKGASFTEERKAKLSAARKGKAPWNKGKKCSDDVRAVMSAVRMGNVPWNKGIKASDETKAKQSAARKGKAPWNKGRAVPEETRVKISESLKGKHLSTETKAKMSRTKKGKKKSPETTAKRLATLARNKERKELLQFWCAL